MVRILHNDNKNNNDDGNNENDNSNKIKNMVMTLMTLIIMMCTYSRAFVFFSKTNKAAFNII